MPRRLLVIQIPYINAIFLKKIKNKYDKKGALRKKFIWVKISTLRDNFLSFEKAQLSTRILRHFSSLFLLGLF